MYPSILVLHIAIALLMGGAALFALADVVRDSRGRLAWYARAIAWGFGVNVVLGSLLALLGEGVSAQSFCANIGSYLLFTGLVEAAIYARLRGVFPLQPALAPVLPALFVASATAIALL